MLNINIVNDTLLIKTINKNSFKNMYSIYSASDFKYATGVSSPMEFEQFMDEISKFILQKDVFFLDILLSSGESIGLIKGTIKESNNILWINSLVINTPYQEKGYGRMAVFLLETYFKQKHSIEKIFLSVSKNNESGKNFWTKCGYFNRDNLSEFAQIMWKIL